MMVMDRDCGYAKSTKLPGTGTVSPVNYMVHSRRPRGVRERAVKEQGS